MDNTLEKKLSCSADYILSKISKRPKLGLILGSGLGSFGDELLGAQYLDYKDIPNFPVSTVAGHKGRFAINDDVLCMQGRFHFYEGYKMEEVTFPVRVMKLLGIETLILTNACGAVNKSFAPGDIMIIKDHINLMGTNPLIGKNLEKFGPRFPDLSKLYSPKLIKLSEETAKKQELKIKKGVYAAFSGPSYETPAEVKMAGILGADAVGMSTVPEAIAAAHSKIQVLGLSCISNMAAGVLDEPLLHEDVVLQMKNAQDKFSRLVSELVIKLKK